MVNKKLKIVAEELFHESPKFLPPRDDLRKRKKLKDPDLEGEDLNEIDPDLEKNS